MASLFISKSPDISLIDTTRAKSGGTTTACATPGNGHSEQYNKIEKAHGPSIMQPNC